MFFIQIPGLLLFRMATSQGVIHFDIFFRYFTDLSGVQTAIHSENIKWNEEGSNFLFQ